MPAGSVTAATSDVAATTDVAVTTASGVDPTTVEVDPTTTVAAEPMRPAEELADLAGITAITVTTPPSNNGEHPLLAWATVEGVELYAVTLTGADGGPYWAWTGPETEVYLGGPSIRPLPNPAVPTCSNP